MVSPSFCSVAAADAMNTIQHRMTQGGLPPDRELHQEGGLIKVQHRLDFLCVADGGFHVQDEVTPAIGHIHDITSEL